MNIDSVLGLLDTPDIPFQDIRYDVTATKNRLAKRTQVSWSAFDSFRSCPSGWFVKYFMQAPGGAILLPRDDTRSLPGTILQKVMEVFLNARVYARPEMVSMQTLLDWMTRNLVATYHLSRCEVSDQYVTEYQGKKFWDTTLGKVRWERVRRNYGMDPAIKEINLSFVDGTTFNGTYGSEEEFLTKLKSIFEPVLRFFVENCFSLDRFLSEIPLKVPYRNFTLTGAIDFLYNTVQRGDMYFSSLAQLESGYQILDGKYNFSSYTKIEQLQYYATLLQIYTGKTPESLSLLSWSTRKTIHAGFNPEYRKEIDTVLAQMETTGVELLSRLETAAGFFFGDSLLPFVAEPTWCQFCPALLLCPEAKTKGITKNTDIATKIVAKQEMRKIISTLGDVKNPSITL